jgi:exosome complex component RRP42
LRADGRGLFAFRNIALETGVAPLANGSARLGLGGTEVLAAVKLEVDDVSRSDDAGRISVNVSWYAAYHMS